MGRMRESIHEIRDRETMIHVRELIEEVLERYAYNFNTKITRAEITHRISILLQDLRDRRLIRDYLVECNDTNNIPEIIDNHNLVVDTYIQGNCLNTRHIRSTMCKTEVEVNNSKRVFSELDPYGEENWE